MRDRPPLRLRRLIPAVLVVLAGGGLSCEQLEVTAVAVDEIVVTPDPAAVEVGGNAQLAARLEDAEGHVLSGRTITWSSDAPSVAAVDATGMITGVATGTTRITAHAEGRTGSASVTVGQSVVATVDVQPAAATLGVGETRQLTATPRDAAGQPVAGRTVTWVSESPGVATVSSTGLVTAVETGSATIRATADGRIGTATITVQRSPVASVTIVPSSATVVVGGMLPLGVELRAANGELITGRTVAWSSGNPGVATVDATGVVTGVSVGTVTITAASEGRSGTATVDVQSRPVASVTIQPAAVSVVAGQTVQLTAELRAADGALLTGRPVAWSSDAAATATVDGTGLVTGVAVGLATIRATAEGITASAAVNVTQKPVATVTVAPPSAGLVIGDTVRLTATLRAGDGTMLTGRKVTWSSASPGTATVDTAGLVRAVAVGTVTITATSEGRTGTSMITVSLKPVASVTLAPASANLIVGDTLRFTATLRASDGSILTGRAVAWSTQDAAVATVDASGKVTALAPGTTGVIAISEGRADTATVTVAPKPVATVTLAPSSASLFTGDTLRLTATLKAADGTTLTGRPIAWSSGNGLIATVDASGKVTALLPGTTSITATSEGKSGSATITVSLKPVATVTILPANPSVLVGATAQLTAELRAADGTILTGRPVAWTSSDATVATVGALTGLVTGLKAGTTTITATSEGKTGQATLTVSQQPVASVVVTPATANMFAGDQLQLTAQTFDGGGGLLTGRPIAWSIANSSPDAAVTGTGLVTAINPGTVIVVATSEGKADSATITITLKPVASVVVTPAASTVIVGATVQLSAALSAADGTPLTGRPITWSSSNTGRATVSTNGLVTTVDTGTVVITATSEGISGTASVTIQPVPVATVTVTPASSNVIIGQTVQLTATTRDAGGNVLTGRAISWSSSNTGKATVSTSGLVTTVDTGTVTITATSEGQSGTATVMIAPVPVATVTVTPASSNVIAGQSVQLTATTRDAGGNVLTGRAISWSSSNTGKATVSTSGLVTTVDTGTVTITATSEGQSGTATVTSAPVPVATVTVTPASSNITVAQAVQLTATTRDGSGNVLTGRVVAWSSADPAIATVDPNTGLVTGVAGGTVTITATSEGQSGTASVTVLEPVASVVVAPDPGTVEMKQTLPMSVTLRASDGTVLTGRVVTWSSGNAGIATVHPNTGLVTGVAVGSVIITATSEGVNGTATVNVTPQSVASVKVVPDPGSVEVKQTLQMTDTLKASDGTVLTGRIVTWSSSDAAIASVDPNTGLVTGVVEGTVTITATSEGKSGGATVNVTPQPVASVIVVPDPGSVEVGATLPMTDTLKAADGTVLTGRTVAWSTSDANTATVDPNTGLVTGVAAGSVTITATSEGVSGSATVNVVSQPVASVTVAPDPGSVEVGMTLQMVDTLRASDGTVLTGRTVSWSSSDPAIASVVASTGVVTGEAVGSVTITATALPENISGTATVNVTAPPAPVDSVEVAPDPGSVEVGQTLPMTATTFDAGGAVLTGRAITWNSSDTNVATVDASGLVSGLVVGSVTITATSEGVDGTATVNVTPPPPPVDSVVVTSDGTAPVPNAIIQLTATVWAGGAVVTDRPVTWASDTNSVASVDTSGLVTIKSNATPGSTATITATAEGKSGTFLITVQ